MDTARVHYIKRFGNTNQAIGTMVRTSFADEDDDDDYSADGVPLYIFLYIHKRQKLMLILDMCAFFVYL